MGEIRDTITMYADQYNFYKELKSKKLLVAFVEYMFEGIEPTDLKGIEKVAFDSLKIRMNNQRKKACAGKLGGSNSHGGGRPTNTAGELGTENKQKTSKKQTEQQAKNKEDKEEVYKENIKRKFLENVLLSESEYNKLVDKYGKAVIERKIEDLNNYIGSKGKKYKSHYFTILERLRRENIKPLEKPTPETINNDLHTDTRASWLKEAFPLNK